MSATRVSRESEPLPPHYRRNFNAILAAHALFGVAFTLIHPDSMLPAFVGQLTDSAPVIGLVNTIFRGGWLLPQLVVARLVNDKPRKKPYMLAGTSGRLAFWVVALALWAGLARYPAAMLILSFTCFALFTVCDGVSGVAWFDIMARAIPPRRRGRVLGIGQAISGLVGIGEGALIGLVLNQRPFPDNYALLFTSASVLFIFATIPLVFIRETPPKNADSQSHDPVRGRWLKLLFANPAFRHLMVCRMLIGMMGLATPFYVKHADQVLRLPQRIIGDFVIAQTLAGVIASVVLGMVCERWGSRYVVCVGSAAAAAGPLFALAAHLAGGGWLVQAYPFVFLSLGIINSTWVMGFFNYLLEIAPEGMRPAYVGLGNTIMGTLTLVPVAGGWLLEATSYTVLFGVTTALVATGFLLTLGLKPPPRGTLVEDPS